MSYGWSYNYRSLDMNTTTYLIDIKLDGNLLSLYHDDLPLKELGRVDVKRASSIEYGGKYSGYAGLWLVVIDGEVVFSHEKRSECIDYEIKYIQEGNTGCFVRD